MNLNIHPVLILSKDVEAVLLCEHKRVEGEWVATGDIDTDRIHKKYKGICLYYDRVDDGIKLESDILTDVDRIVTVSIKKAKESVK